MAQNETSKLIDQRIRERAEAQDVSAEELRILAAAWAELHRNDPLEAAFRRDPDWMNSTAGFNGKE